jgi:glycerophosphoryl diester phosphodiesterase
MRAARCEQRLRAGDGLDPVSGIAYCEAVAAPWLRIAHRGASGTAPEHTRAAFVRALELGADMIELDVQLTRDEQLVVLHDRDLERTTNGRGAVREHTLAEIKALDAGSWFGPQFAGETVLSLPEVLVLVGTAARLNLEVKAPRADWPVLAPRLIGTLGRHQAIESTIISCFEPEALSAVRERSDRARLGLLWEHTSFDDAWRWTEQLHTVSIHPLWLLISSDLVRAAHVRHLDVLTWTVNEIAAMQVLIEQGVDGIISDFPERLRVVQTASDTVAYQS